MPTNLYNNIKIPMKIAVFASGSGTNFEKIYEKQKEMESQNILNYAEISLVFSNNPKAVVLSKAESFGIKGISLSSKNFFNLLEKKPDDENLREAYDAAVITLIEQYLEPDIIVLAGYRRKLSSLFIDRYINKIINLYPGDITKDYLVAGKQAYLQAIENGEKSIRCTCYVENDQSIRFGPAIAQSKEISLRNCSLEDSSKLSIKIREEGEWQLFPYVVHNLIANGRVGIDKEKNILIDNKKMGLKGLQL